MKPGRLSKNFRRSEFECQCGCGFDIVDAELVLVLEIVRSYFGGRRVLIRSGCRCALHNAAIGGSKKSYHLQGKAADIVVEGVPANDVADYLEEIFSDRYGIGRYNGRTHLDVRKYKARWDNREKGE